MGRRRLADFLSVVPEDDWEAPRRLLARFPAGADRLAFLIVRPDAVLQGLTHAVLGRLQEHGFQVVDCAVMRPHPRVLEELYRYTQARLLAVGMRAMWWYTPQLYELAPAVVVLAHHPARHLPAARILAEMKGPANPAIGVPGQLRYDFRAQNVVMCVLHSSDGTDTAAREACLFFGSSAVASRMAEAEAGDIRPCPWERLLEEHGIRNGGIVFRENFHQVLGRLQARILSTLGGSAEHVKLAEDTVAAVEDSLASPDYMFRAEVMRRHWTSPGASQLVARLPSGDAADFLAWTIRFSGTEEALMDEVLLRLAEHGYPLDPYDATLLATGFGFDTWMVTEYAERAGTTARQAPSERGIAATTVP